jgi:surface carbohydrate biosynthesis protein
MKRVLIITDHKWRDLAGYVYLKALLEKNHGVSVRLCRLGEERFWVLHERPDLVIYNHLYEDKKVQFAYWLKKQNVGVMILPTEGIPFEKMQDLAAGKFTDLKPVDLYLSWNEPMAKKIVELKKLPPEKLRVVGVPRFDFYFPPLSKLLPGKEEVQRRYGLGVDQDAPIILYATNFTIASFNGNKSFLYKDWETLKLNRVEDYKPDRTENLIKKDILSRSLTIESVKRLLKDIPHIQIIYKPHPSENHLFYKDIIEQLKAEFPGRFAFVAQEYIWNLLNASDILLQRTCTTAIEAWIFGKPTLELQLHPEEFYFSKEHASGSDVVHSYEDIKERVSYYSNGGKIADSIKTYRTNFLKKWCHTLDGNRTVEVSRIIAQFLQEHEKTRYSFSTEEFLSYYPKEYLKQLFRYGRNFVWKQVLGVDKIGRIDKQFTQKDLKFWERHITSAGIL